MKYMTAHFSRGCRTVSKMKLVKEKGVSKKSDLNIAYNAGLVFSLCGRIDTTMLVSGSLFFFLFIPDSPGGQSPRSQGHLTF